MRIVLFTTSYHLGASITMTRFLREKNIQVVGIVETHMASFSRKTWNRMRLFIRKSGFWYFCQTTALAMWHEFSMKFCGIFLPRIKRKTYTIDELGKRYGIPICKTEDINSKEVHKFVRKRKADLGVSILLMQKVEKKLLQLPSNGCINLHPGLMPKYKGTFMHFWPLVNREKMSGVTVHYMTEKFDEGKILARKKFRIRRRYTQQCLMEKSAKIGSKLLAKTIHKLQRREKLRVTLAQVKEKLPHFSYPTPQSLLHFRNRGKKFLRRRNLLRI